MKESILDISTAITQNKKSQSIISPKLAIDFLKAGNRRFVDNRKHHRDSISQVKQTTNGQYPFASIISCIDSRIPTELVFDQGIGDMFNTRIAGNFVNADILGSLEFSCKLAGAKVIVVMGHTSCGAVKGACDHAKLGNLTQMLDKITPAVNAIKTAPDVDRSSSNLDFVNAVSAKNVVLNIDRIKMESPVLKEMYDKGEIDIVGAMYDVANGQVQFFKELDI